jgi:hypothetical protein
LAVTSFDPVQIEIARGLLLLGSVAVTQVLRPAMGKPVGAGVHFILCPRRSLPHCPKIHHIRHSNASL